jgi:hypothetical protein
MPHASLRDDILHSDSARPNQRRVAPPGSNPYDAPQLFANGGHLQSALVQKFSREPPLFAQQAQQQVVRACARGRGFVGGGRQHTLALVSLKLQVRPLIFQVSHADNWRLFSNGYTRSPLAIGPPADR